MNLLHIHSHIETPVFSIVKERYQEVKNDLNLDVYLEQEFKQIEQEFSKNNDAILFAKENYEVKL